MLIIKIDKSFLYCSTASGFIAGALSGLTEPECVELGLKAGLDSLRSNNPVPDHFRVSLEQKYAVISPILIHKDRHVK